VHRHVEVKGQHPRAREDLHREPGLMPMRGSSRLVRPAMRKPTVIPKTTAADHLPTNASGKLAYCCRSGGSNTIGVKLSMP